MPAKPQKRANEPILLRDDQDGVATLTLNRPDKYNALSRELMGMILDHLDRLAHDRHVRVVVLAARGKAFCAGHDLREMLADPSPPAMEALFQQCSQMMLALQRIPQPVIARVHGTATAAGCQLVAQCDLAVAAATAKFATSGINVGLYCGTPSVAVSRNLPRKQAMEMLLTGEFIDAKTALHYGLVNKVVPQAKLDAAVAKMAKTIADKGPAFIAAGKQLFYRQIENGMNLAYKHATDVMVQNMQRPDARKGIEAFLNKRPMPKWQDR
ncbi:MAG: enoyl-CoA hydratase [Rhodospirillales bacterium]|nr:enoyl-CoA hydratase [Rhodospirillales bacterium]